MEYIVVERTRRETNYVEEFHIGNSIYMTDVKEEAHRYGLSDAMTIADRHGMTIEEAN